MEEEEHKKEDHGASCNGCSSKKAILVDVIIPVHNAESTLRAAVESALTQTIPQHLLTTFLDTKILLSVCCYDDGSTDNSWKLLKQLKDQHSQQSDAQLDDAISAMISSNLFIQSSEDGVARGAAFARNRAAEIRNSMGDANDGEINESLHFLCLLDSDDMMHPTRVAEQVSGMMALSKEERCRTLLGCKFERDPPDSTWHYAKWANGLSDERLMLERFREITIIQPTWLLCRSRWKQLKGFVEALPSADNHDTSQSYSSFLIHPDHDTSETIKLAEDLRFFHSHLNSDGLLRLHRSQKEIPLVTYRHSGSSQSFRTSRKLLLQLRVLAFEITVLRSDELWQQHDGKFVVWGAGRDGKDFVKALQPDLRGRIYCFVDVDAKKIESGHYDNRDIGVRIPIIHYSLLAKDPELRTKLLRDWEQGIDGDEEFIGKIDKGKPQPIVVHEKRSRQPRKRRKTNPTNLERSLLSSLPVVVCVAMYRTNGILEKNVERIGRTEGKDLWHFS